jgi:dTDP-4-dehydrorhamnose reductase
MKVLVLGAGGMAGHVVSLYLRENGFDVDTLSARNALDEKTHIVNVLELDKLKAVLGTDKYDVVVNCIGLLVKQSEERKDLAVYINAFLPHFLEQHFSDSKTRMVHLSTDCVFSGKNPPYREDATCDGELFYDRSKALGEIINNKDLTFRMSIIGPDMQKTGIGLFNWFYKQTGQIFGYTNAMWNGITTIELAKGIKGAIEQNLTGLYQLAPSNSISKFDLLQLFKEVFGTKDISIKPTKGLAVNATLINTRKDFNYQISDYKTMVYDMKVWMENHPELYTHYEK